MHLLADESVDYGIIKNLRSLGIEILSIMEISPGISDQEVLKLANQKNLLLVTEDKDFGELVHRLKMEHKGILLIRMNDVPRNERLTIIPEAIKISYPELENNFSVLMSNGLRIKRH